MIMLLELWVVLKSEMLKKTSLYFACTQSPPLIRKYTMSKQLIL